MASSADVLVRFLADTSQVDNATRTMGGTLKSFAKNAAVLFGGAAIGAFAKDSIDAANNMAETVSKVDTVFGKSAGTIQRFAKGAAENLGLSRQSALDAAGAYGNMFTQLGLTTDQAADMSKGMLTLTSDIASFHNVDPTQVIDAQSAAFRGEYDALQRFIPTINAAAVEQRAMRDTGKDSADQLTATEKAAATYALMIEGAGKATGDFARTSDSAANQQRIMAAKTDDASVSIGQALAPALAIVVPLIGQLATAFAGAEKPIQLATVALAGFLAISIAIGGPIGAIIAAVGAVGVAIFLMWTYWDQIWSWIKDHPAYAAVIALLFPFITIAFLIIGAIKALWENWDAIFAAIKQATSDAADWVTQAFDDVVAFFEGIPGAIGSALSTIWDVITSPFRTAVDEVLSIVRAIGGVWSDVIGGVRGIWNGFARGWNGIHLDIPSVDLGPLGEIGGGSFNLPNLPLLASGGIVTGPTLAMLGEAGPEAVVPLSRGFGTTNVYQISIDVAPTASPADVGAAVVDSIRSYERANGTAWRN